MLYIWSFRDNFDIFINYQQRFIVLFGQKRSGTQLYTGLYKTRTFTKIKPQLWFAKAYGKQNLRIDLYLLLRPKKDYFVKVPMK